MRAPIRRRKRSCNARKGGCAFGRRQRCCRYRLRLEPAPAGAASPLSLVPASSGDRLLRSASGFIQVRQGLARLAGCRDHAKAQATRRVGRSWCCRRRHAMRQRDVIADPVTRRAIAAETAVTRDLDAPCHETEARRATSVERATAVRLRQSTTSRQALGAGQAAVMPRIDGSRPAVPPAGSMGTSRRC